MNASVRRFQPIVERIQHRAGHRHTEMALRPLPAYSAASPTRNRRALPRPPATPTPADGSGDRWWFSPGAMRAMDDGEPLRVDRRRAGDEIDRQRSKIGAVALQAGCTWLGSCGVRAGWTAKALSWLSGEIRSDVRHSRRMFAPRRTEVRPQKS